MEILKDFGSIEIFIAFFLPGFIVIRVYETFLPSAESKWTERIPEAVSYSALYYAATLWILPIVPQAAQFVVTYFIVFLGPIAAGLLMVAFRHGSLRVKLRPEATPWDRVFSRFPLEYKDGLILRLTRKDGTQLIGLFGGRSYASTFPRENQLYLQALCDESGGSLKVAEPLRGLLINASEISSLTFELPPATLN